MILGTQSGAVAQDLTVDKRFMWPVTVPEAGVIARSAVRLSDGSAAGSQQLRGVLYRGNAADAPLVAVGASFVVADAAAAAWYELGLQGVELDAGVYCFGLQAGAVSLAAAILRTSAVTAITDTYADGAAAVLGAVAADSRPAFYADVSPAWAPPAIPDEELAQRGWVSSQIALGGAPSGAARQARAEWHGTSIDARRGALALVRDDGVLADLVGERVRVTFGARSANVYVVASSDIDEDISLTRRAWMALANASRDFIDVRVEVIA